MIDEGLRTLLLAQAGITALAPAQTVGLVSIPAVFVDAAVQGVLPPYVLITITGGDPLVTLDSTYHETLRQYEIDIDSFSYDKTAANTLNKTIRQFLDDYTGAAGSNDTIKSVYFDSEVGGFDFPNEGDDKKAFFVTTSYQMMVTQT